MTRIVEGVLGQLFPWAMLGGLLLLTAIALWWLPDYVRRRRRLARLAVAHGVLGPRHATRPGVRQ